ICIELMPEGGRLQFVSKHWRGEVARFDILDRDGNVIVEKDKRINARHVRQLEEAKIEHVSIPEEALVGRTLAKNVINPDTGEIIAKANDEITETMLTEFRQANIHSIETLYVNDLDQGGYISLTLRTDDTADQLAARVAIYRM